MSQTMSINFDLGNAAFEDQRSRELEIYRILGDIREKVINGRDEGMIHDVNGNRIGTWAYDVYQEDTSDREQCTKCCCTLEEGQIGLCDDCQEEGDG